ncbi:MAG: O-antigen ligase family protein [Bacilli bacterium]
MDNKIYQFNYYSLLICILIFPICMLIKYTSLYFNLDNVYFSFNLLRMYWLILPLHGFIYIYCLYKKIIKPNYFDYIMYILILAGVISSVLAIDYDTAIFGYTHRYEGFIVLLSYYLIFLNSRLIDCDKRFKILNVWLLMGILQSLYAVFQVIFKVPFVMKFKWIWMASGLNGNPNFFGSYMVLLGLLSIGLYLFSSRHRVYYLICSIIFIMSLILAQSTGPLIGYFVGLFVLLLIILVRKIKVGCRLNVLCISLIITFLFGVYGTDYLFNDIYHYENMDNYTIKGDIDRVLIYGCDILDLECNFVKKNTNLIHKEDITLDQLSSNRITIWKNSIPIIKDNYLVGVGLDNLGLAYNKYYHTQKVDKAHNVYLQILVTNGIIGFIPYMIWLFMVIQKGLKIKSVEMLTLSIPIIGYSVQALFNISVVDVAPLFYMLSGMIVGFKEE